MLFGTGKRTAIEVEMRISDGQALARRLALKIRDDPTDGILLVVADTRHNRRALAEFPGLIPDVPQVRTASVRAALRRGEHPASGLVLL